MRTAPKSILFITAITLAVGLTGCSAGGQSVAEACKVFGEEGAKITSEAQGMISTVTTDPQAAIDALGDVQDKFKALGDKITNDEVKPAYDDFVSAYGEFTAILGDVAKVASEDPSKAADALGKITDVSTKVQDSTKKLQEVCS